MNAFAYWLFYTTGGNLAFAAIVLPGVVAMAILLARKEAPEPPAVQPPPQIINNVTVTIDGKRAAPKTKPASRLDRFLN